MNYKDIRDYLSKYNISLNDDVEKRLEKYYEILTQTNKKFNLTAITEKEEVYEKHFLDSLTVALTTNLENKKILDIGTGAGFPGLVLKILYPSINLTLIDSSKKKINFLQNLAKELELDVECIACRAEEYGLKVREQFDIVVSRAVASLSILLELLVAPLKVDGYLIAMKGSKVEEELLDVNQITKNLNLVLNSTLSLHLPNNHIRNLLIYVKTAPTISKYPRPYNQILKSNK